MHTIAFLGYISYGIGLGLGRTSVVLWQGLLSFFHAL